MPTRLIQNLPVLANMRTPARAAVYVYLFFGILGGIAIACFLQKVRWRYAVAPLLALVMLDYYPSEIRQKPIALPEAYDIVREDTGEDFGVLDIPPSMIQGSRHMMYQTFHGKKIVNGYVSRKSGKSLVDHLKWTSLEKQSQQLLENRVKYIVIDKSKRMLMLKYKIDMNLYRSQYPLIHEDKDFAVFKLFD